MTLSPWLVHPLDLLALHPPTHSPHYPPLASKLTRQHHPRPPRHHLRPPTGLEVDLILRCAPWSSLSTPPTPCPSLRRQSPAPLLLRGSVTTPAAQQHHTAQSVVATHRCKVDKLLLAPSTPPCPAPPPKLSRRRHDAALPAPVKSTLQFSLRRYAQHHSDAHVACQARFIKDAVTPRHELGLSHMTVRLITTSASVLLRPSRGKMLLVRYACDNSSSTSSQDGAHPL